MELAPDTHPDEYPWTIAVEWARPWHRPLLPPPAAAKPQGVTTARRPAGRSIAAGKDLLKSPVPIGWSVWDWQSPGHVQTDGGTERPRDGAPK